MKSQFDIENLFHKAKSFYSKGKQAEARQHYEEAYQNYKQAYDLHPEETQYRSAFERSKFLAAASHVRDNAHRR